MNDKILIDLFIPQISRKLEVYVPVHLKFKVINQLLGQIATAVTNGEFSTCEELLLCEASTGKPFALGKTPATLGLQNGVKTMLV